MMSDEMFLTRCTFCSAVLETRVARYWFLLNSSVLERY